MKKILRWRDVLILGALLLGGGWGFHPELSTSSEEEQAHLATVAIDSPSPLIQIVLMIRSGSAHDPSGKEGLAYLTAWTLLDGGYGDVAAPVTKEQLALRIRRWGTGAKPRVQVGKEVTVFYAQIPAAALPTYLREIFGPLFTRPLFEKMELQRLRNEVMENISGPLRHEDLEGLGLNAIDHFVFEETPYAHLPEGSLQGLKNIRRQDLWAFYRRHYRTENLILGLSSTRKSVARQVREALQKIGHQEQLTDSAEKATPQSDWKPHDPQGRQLVIVSVPNAASTGIHVGFPIEVTRQHPDYWPLYVAHVHFGVHRDSFGHLFREIRQKRGYNYGNYAYIEHFQDRPRYLFPPFNAPRRHQYFSIWVRPVGHTYTHHILKAVTWELETFIRKGLNDEEVEKAKNKAKVLYLNLAETVSRLVQARVDDLFYARQEPGYLQSYLKEIETVTTEQVNESIRQHLQTQNLKYLVVTSRDMADQLAEDLATGRRAGGKPPQEYRGAVEKQNGVKQYRLSEKQLQILRQDAVWEAYPLEISPRKIRVVPVERLFETRDFIAPPPS